MKTWFSAAVLSLALTGAALGQSDPGWTRYDTGPGGFAVDLPLAQFEPTSNGDGPSVTFLEHGGSGQINLYGGDASGMSLEAFASRFVAEDSARQITYQAQGQSWFVLSGFYRAQAGSEPLIFYTKVLLSPDRQRFSGFEISYPAVEKTRYDAIVERIEDSFSRPR